VIATAAETVVIVEIVQDVAIVQDAGTVAVAI